MQASGDQSAIFGRDGAPSPRRQGPLSVLRSVVAWGFPCLRRDDALVYNPPMSPLAIIALILATVAAMEGVAWTSHKYFRWAPRRGYAKRLVQAHKLHRSEEQTSEIQTLMRNSYAVLCLKQKNHSETT